jgi:hypothetical protein
MHSLQTSKPFLVSPPLPVTSTSTLTPRLARSMVSSKSSLSTKNDCIMYYYKWCAFSTYKNDFNSVGVPGYYFNNFRKGSMFARNNMNDNGYERQLNFDVGRVWKDRTFRYRKGYYPPRTEICFLFQNFSQNSNVFDRATTLLSSFSL